MQINNEIILEKVKNFLVSAASDLLRISDMDIDKDFEDYGLDSISNVQFVNKINEYYSIDLMPTVLFELDDPTIRTLAGYLCNKYTSELSSFYKREQEVEEISSVPVRKDKPVRYFKEESIIKEPDKEEKREEPRFEAISRFIHPEMKEKVTYIPSVDRENEPIAIIGMQGKFPKSQNLDEFWMNLKDGKQLITETPTERFDWKEFNDPALRWGGFMEDIDKFDADFFGIAKQDAEAMDPQHRLFLQTTWSAIEDAGYKPSDLSGTKTAVFIGIGTKDYSELMNQKNGIGYNPFAITGREPFMLCNRLSSMLNLHGPSEAIDTTCSSSLLAVHKAVESIHIGSSEMAIVGGVNIILTPSNYVAYSNAGMLSKTGQCRVFDKDADGTVRSEGVGTIILKPLSAAIRDGDHIYALIKATSQNHKGKSASLTAPNANAEADLIMDVFHKAKVDPSTVNYIEAHSTGTKLGDPIEITAIKKALKELYTENGITLDKQTCAISSLKANVGHLETASGIAALMKVILSLQHNQILGVGNFKELNPYIDLTDTPVYINEHNRPWNRVVEGVPRRAGISAFGYGGVNAHIMIEEYMGEKESQPTVKITKDNPVVILLSARNKDRLREQAKLLCNALDEQQFVDSDLANIAYTLQIGRETFEERLAFTAVTINDVRETLSKFIQGGNDSVYTGRVQKKNEIITMLEHDKGMEGIINSWMINKEYNKLLKLWVSGWQINWSMLYKSGNLKRISLPTYPFEKNRYWLNLDVEDVVKQPLPQKPKVEKVQMPASIEEKNQKSEKIDNAQKDCVREIIVKVASNLLCVNVNEIDENQELSEYGIDSIILTQLLQQLQTIDPTLDFETLYNCNTIYEIIEAVHLPDLLEQQISTEKESENKKIEVAKSSEIVKVPEKEKNIELKFIEMEHETTAKLIKEAESFALPTQYPEIIRLNKASDKRPVFWFHGGFGGVEIYRIIAQNLERPFYGIQAKGYLTDDAPILGMEEMASYYIKLIKSVQKEGPYDLGGLSMGGVIAYEVTKQLQEMGDSVNSIVMLESLFQDEEVKKTWTNIETRDIKKERMLRAVNLLLGFTSSVQLELISEKE
ncbi:MAG: beta-ketoacyl synthase N-terminal-like domain-containing protein, partial [Acutalibacteraceae bacterium]|nr:beta-ketoacyl synthase N-terminal-like domain-containing protein [Acutalibacteraceae bacterium]